MKRKKLGSFDVELLKKSIKEIDEPDIRNDNTKMYYVKCRIGVEDPSSILRLYVIEDKNSKYADLELAFYDFEDSSLIMDLRTKVKNYAEFKKEILKIDGIQRVKVLCEDSIFKNNSKSLFGLYVLD